MEFTTLFPMLQDEPDCVAEIMSYVMCGTEGVRDFYRCAQVCKGWNEMLKEDHFYFQLANTQVTYESLLQKYNRYWTEKQTSNSHFWRQYVPLMLEEQKSSEWIKIKEDLAFFDKEALIEDLVELLEKRKNTKPEMRNKEKERQEVEALAVEHGGCWVNKIPFNQYSDWMKPLSVPGWNSIEDQVKAAVKILTYKHGYFVNLDRIFSGKTLIAKKESQEITIQKASNIRRTTSTSYSDFSDVDKVLHTTINTVLQYNSTANSNWSKYCSETISWYFEWICYGANEFDPVIKKMVNVRFGNLNKQKPTDSDIVDLVEDIKTLATTALFNPSHRRDIKSRDQQKEKWVEITRKLSEDIEAKHREMSQFRKAEPTSEATWTPEEKQSLLNIILKRYDNKELANEIANRMASHMSPDQVIGTEERFLEPEIDWERELIEQAKEISKIPARLDQSNEISVN